MNRFFNMTSLKYKCVFSLLAVPCFAIILLSQNTYAIRVDVDVNNLDDYFTGSIVGGGSFYDNGSSVSFDSSKSFLVFNAKNSVVSSLSCNNQPIYVRVVYGQSFFNFTPSSNNDWAIYISGSYNNGIIYQASNNYIRVPVWSSSVDTLPYLSDGLRVYYKFDSITLGCSADEVASSIPTPTSTPTPTPTAEPTPTPDVTPTPTEDVINPDDYEYDPVEDSIVKYRFMSVILIFGAGLLLYHLIIKRIILR